MSNRKEPSISYKILGDAGLDNSIPDRGDVDEQISPETMGRLAMTITEFVRSKTGFVDEGMHTLALSMGVLCAMQESFGGVSKDKSRAHAKEVLDRVLSWELYAMEADVETVLHGDEAREYIEKHKK